MTSAVVAVILRLTLKQQLNPTEGGVEKLAGKARRRVMPRHGEDKQGLGRRLLAA